VLATLLPLMIYGCSRDSDELTVAVVAPLSGENASSGVKAVEGARLAAESLAAREAMGGRKIRIVSRDERKANPASLLSDLVRRDRPVAVIGLSSSAVVSASGPLAREGIPALVIWGSAGKLDVKAPVLRLGPSNAALSERVSRWLVTARGLKRVAIAASSDEKGSDGAKAVSRAVSRLHGDVVASVSIDPDALDMTTVAQGLQSSGADALVIWAPPRAAARLCLAVRAIGWDVQIAGSDDLVDPEFRVLAGGSSDGVALALPDISPQRWLGPALRDWLGDYHRRFTVLPIADQRTLVTALPYSAITAYDAVNAVADAARRAGKKGDIRAELAKTKSFDGVLNDYRFVSREAFEVEDLRISRFYNFSLLSDVDEGADVAEQIAFYKVQVSGFFLSDEYLESEEGRELSERVLEDVLNDPDSVDFFKPYRHPLPAPGKI